MRIWYRRLIWLLAIYAFQRLLFFYFNAAALNSVPIGTLLWSLSEGLRFDLCAIATINTPILALHYSFYLITSSLKAPPNAKWRTARLGNQVIGLIFLAANIPMIAFGIIDSRMFAFTGRRFTLDLLAIAGDIQEQSLGILVQYWPLTLISFAAIGLFSWKTMQIDHIQSIKPSGKKEVYRVMLTSALALLLIRGGWQTKPLSPAHAYAYQPAALANMVLNSSMTIMRTPSGSSLKPVKDFASMADVRKILDVPSDGKPIAKGKNFIVLIVESLATEYVGGFNKGRGYTPFIDSLIKKSITFEHSFANGRRSIDAMPAIFAAVPAWRDQPFVTSPYATNSVRALPREMKALGYSSAFFHGASTGTMHFDVFSKIAGFDRYIGREDYPDKQDDDGQWGIFDEPFLKFASQQISLMKEPFVAGIFTLSSHNPFKIPTSYEGKFPKGTLPIHESIGYADFALKKFFDEASNQSWFKNTIFIITGDHTSLSDDRSYDNFQGKFKVPIIFFDPSGALNKNSNNQIATHIDITPTIFHLAGLKFDTPWLLGGALFAPAWQGRFVQQRYDDWTYLDETHAIVLTDGSEPRYFAPDDLNQRHALPATPDATEKTRVLLAYRQYFLNGMIENSWIHP